LLLKNELTFRSLCKPIFSDIGTNHIYYCIFLQSSCKTAKNGHEGQPGIAKTGQQGPGQNKEHESFDRKVRTGYGSQKITARTGQATLLVQP
jgi:hypothetical protein